MASNLRRASIGVPLLLLLAVLLLLTSRSAAVSGTTRRRSSEQISRCSEMASESECTERPKCRWCRSEILDDMCFSHSEAWRLPQQVFSCGI